MPAAPMPPQQYQSGPVTPPESAGRRPPRLFLAFRAPWIDRGRLDDAFARQHRHDEVGVRLHTLLAVGALLALTTTNTAAEIAFAPLAVYSIIRLGHTWRSLVSLFQQPATVCCLGYLAWAGASLLWTRDLRHGLDELAMVRALAVGMMLWPVLENRRWLIAALAVGFAAGNVLQVAHAIGTRLELSWLPWDRWEGRNSVWWDPVVGGTLLTGALGLHLPAAFMGRGRVRALALGGAGLAAFGVLATGSRGAWVASGTLVLIVVGIAIWRVALRKDARARSLLAPLGLVALVGVAGWLLAGDLLVSRYERARQDIARSVEGGDYASDTGARLLMAGWAIDAAREHPVAGVGLGGYRAWVVDEINVQGADPGDRPVHDHAHNAYLHIAATTGLVGLALCVGALAFALVGGFRAGGAGGRRLVDLTGYDAGPVFALLGLALAAMFDTAHLSVQSAILLVVVLTLCPSVRPAERVRLARR